MTRPYRDTFTVTRKPDGTFEAKMHGYPFFFSGSTAEACMGGAGRAMDEMAAHLDRLSAQLGKDKE